MILVTGGTGNVGANIVRQLLDAGEQVRVVTRAPGEHSLPGEAAPAPVDPRDIAAVAVHALLEERAGETYTVTGPRSLTQLDRVRIIGETIGRPVRFEELPRDTVRQQMVQHGMPAPAADELLDGLAARVGEPAATLPTVEELTGRRAFTYAEWVSRHRAAFAPAVTS